jgi:hypothetical protein
MIQGQHHEDSDHMYPHLQLHMQLAPLPTK